VLSDLRLAWRRLRKSPGFTTVTVLTLALCIGANTAIYGLIDAIVLRPPCEDAQRVVVIAKDNEGGTTSFPAFRVWRDQARAFEEMAARRSATCT
jgi:hypothetical protein